jgi:16S rRNA U1498 N3-methylase RsmE
LAVLVKRGMIVKPWIHIFQHPAIDGISVIITQAYELGTTIIVPFIYDHKFCVMRDHQEILKVKIVVHKT